MVKSAEIVQLITKQRSCIRDMVCSNCGYAGEETLPTSMKSQHVPCKGCGKTGYMMGLRKKD